MPAKTYPRWIDWAKELQFIAQVGLTYSKDCFDQERFKRIREIATQMVSDGCDMPMEVVRNLFCNESGFQTPKLDTRAAIFQGGKILLVRERNGLWSLPGGWVDVMESVRSNTEKEVREEAGLEVRALSLIALHDRNKHNSPPYAYNICKVFVLCEVVGGCFRENPETTESCYFSIDELPALDQNKNTRAQIEMCFLAADAPHWQTVFD